MKERFRVTGMTCSACSSHVEKAVRALEGVEVVSVNLLTEKMEVSFREEKINTDAIIAAVVKAGYGAFLEKDEEDRSKSTSKEENREAEVLRKRLFLSILFLIPLMYVAMGPMVGQMLSVSLPGPENGISFALTQLLLLLPILFLNQKYFRVGFKTLLHKSPNMDSLVALGATASVVYGIFAMYRMAYGMNHGLEELVHRYHHDLYFESAGMILTLVTVGKYLEGKSKGKTGEALRKLMNLSPTTAIVLDEQGKEKEVPTESICVGDIFVVKPGGRIPVDAQILEGYTGIDESAITGESIPAEKQVGDRVIGATINLTGFIRCRAEKVGEDTTLAQIIHLVEEAGGSKAPIAKLADRVAGIFVPVVMGISLLTLVIWLLLGADAEFAISCAIAVLVISCPCALGLATPVAIMVGTGVGANRGILVKSGESLQALRDIDTVVLDKTGTITEGKLHVMEIELFRGGISTTDLLTLVYGLEKKSEHPMAEAICREGDRVGVSEIPMEAFQSVFGRGVQGTLCREYICRNDGLVTDGPSDENGIRVSGEPCVLPQGTRIFVGNLLLMQENRLAFSKEIQLAGEEAANRGLTPLYVGLEDLQGNKSVIGVILVADQVKKTSKQAVAKLREMGIEVIMLTGDNALTAEAVREQVDINRVIAQVLPGEKEQKIRLLQEQGRKVCMVGDGINDAPALTTAHVGMAIGAGTDIAMESADVILMRSDLKDVVTAIALGRAVLRNIKQNLFWAFFYNCIGIPLAAGLFYLPFGLRLSPMFGAAAMSFSSVFVVTNALRLRVFSGPFGKEQNECQNGAADVKCGETQVEEIFTEQKQMQEEKKMTKKMIIEGMMCSHCTGRVQKALEELAGAGNVTMSLEEKSALITLNSEIADEALTEAVTKAGYEVVSVENVN